MRLRSSDPGGWVPVINVLPGNNTRPGRGKVAGPLGMCFQIMHLFSLLSLINRQVAPIGERLCIPHALSPHGVAWGRSTVTGAAPTPCRRSPSSSIFRVVQDRLEPVNSIGPRPLSSQDLFAFACRCLSFALQRQLSIKL